MDYDKFLRKPKAKKKQTSKKAKRAQKSDETVKAEYEAAREALVTGPYREGEIDG